MKRRGFLAALFGLALAPFLPALAVAKGHSWWKIFYKPAILNEHWLFVHPDVTADFKSIIPRGMWQDAYRLARKAGEGHLRPALIMEKYGYKPSHWTGEIGTIEDVRFIISNKIWIPGT